MQIFLGREDLECLNGFVMRTLESVKVLSKGEQFVCFGNNSTSIQPKGKKMFGYTSCYAISHLLAKYLGYYFSNPAHGLLHANGIEPSFTVVRL